MLPQPNQIIIPLSPPAVLCAPPTSEQRRSRQETERKGDASGTHVRPDSPVGEIFFSDDCTLHRRPRFTPERSLPLR